MSRSLPPSSDVDEFDAILAPAASSPPPALAGSARTHTHAHESPALHEFTDNWALYRDPVLAGVLAGVALSALGVFVLLRRAVFLTAALSQAAGLGVALAFFAEIHLGVSISPVIGALGLCGLCTVLIGVRAPLRVSREALVGFLFVGASALAVLVGDRIAQEAHDIAAILFGTAVLVRPLDLALLALGAALSLGGVLTLGRALTFTGLDPDGARVQGLPVQLVETVFWALFALEVSVATRALGSLPVFAFAVLPAATGLMLASRIRGAILVAIAVGGLSGALGYAAAFFAELPVGATQAATALFVTLGAFAVSRFKSS
jgi:zinc transport system permease protein